MEHIFNEKSTFWLKPLLVQGRNCYATQNNTFCTRQRYKNFRSKEIQCNTKPKQRATTQEHRQARLRMIKYESYVGMEIFRDTATSSNDSSNSLRVHSRTLSLVLGQYKSTWPHYRKFLIDAYLNRPGSHSHTRRGRSC